MTPIRGVPERMREEAEAAMERLVLDARAAAAFRCMSNGACRLYRYVADRVGFHGAIELPGSRFLLPGPRDMERLSDHLYDEVAARWRPDLPPAAAAKKRPE